MRVYKMSTPMCASAHVASSNKVKVRVLSHEDWLLITNSNLS